MRALEETVRDHHRFMLAQHLAQIDFLDEQIAALKAAIADRATAAVPRLPVRPDASAPLVSNGAAAEIGTDMTRFASAAHLACWAKLCPSNQESAGKHLSGKTGQGDR